MVQFLIHSNGMVDASSIKIAKSSGKAILDRNAIDAVLDAIPFELPPKEELEIAIPVVFKLKS
ncbi:energy transducer TonB family protein [Sulfurospirillum diekertiae]|uniref:energy transducer TonB family protein n=1 Tax=Sulfurospirillum diekertiae TaxID=1854492 RepID=UPI0013747CC0|nr:energy transducer TonB [Sulfurospirillum diekertiae]